MRWSVGLKRSRREERLTRPEKRIPIAYGQRHVRVLGGSLWFHAMRVNEEDVASRGSDQDKWYVSYCLAHG
jgi:hypothetical protein